MGRRAGQIYSKDGGDECRGAKTTMARVFVIRDWDKHFEVAQTRRVAALSWVAFPTKHDGKSFRRLMLRSDATETYGVWCLLVQVAAKCVRRGVLADQDGPLDFEDFAIKTGAPAVAFQRALPILADPRIGWVTEDEYEPPPIELGARSTTDRQTDRQTNKQTNVRSNERSSLEISEVPEIAKDVADAVWKKIGYFKGDDALVKKIGMAVAIGTLPESLAFDAADVTAAKKAANPMAFFTKTLKNKCRDSGVDFTRILGTTIPKGKPK